MRGTAGVYNRGTKSAPSWWIRFWDPKTRRQIREHVASAKLKSEAAAVLARRKAEVFAGTYFPERKKSGLTVGQLQSMWLDQKARKRSIAADRTRFGLLVELLGASTPVESLTGDRVRELVKELEGAKTRRGAPMKPASVNRHLALLRAALRLSSAREYITRDPFDGIKLLDEDNERDRVCSPTELRALLAGAGHNLWLAILIGYHSGMREGEIAGLRWEPDGVHGWVDLEARVARLPVSATKTRKDRVVPLAPGVLDVLRAERARRRSEDRSSREGDMAQEDGEAFRKRAARVVPISRATIASAFSRLARECGIRGLTFHDLRHTALTRLRRGGVDVFTIGAISGHRDMSSLRRYQTHSEDDLLAAIEKARG